MPIIEIQSLDYPGVEIFSSLTEAQLRNRLDPERGIYMIEERNQEIWDNEYRTETTGKAE